MIEQPSSIDLNELRAQAAAGEVPDFFRVNVEPRISPDGDLWISFSADGAVRKYARDGSPLAEHELEGPEVERIFEAYVRANAEAESGVHPLNYVADFEVVGHEVWVLLNLPHEESGQVLVLDDGAEVDRRIRLPEVYGAGRLAVDTARDRLYLGVPDLAQVLVVSE